MKKLLALVLALVMTLSLCVVSSNAKFDDAADVNYTQAVDVMSAVGVFVGDGSGKFYPTQNLTRAQAAKIIAYLDLGESVAEALPAVGAFDDVPATHWAAKYVAYCADSGIVAGVGGGKFAPDAQVTGYEFAKMLLVVLKYDAKIEGLTGATWAISCAKLVKENNLAKGYKGVMSAALTREGAAQLAFRTIQAIPVDSYSGYGLVVNPVNGQITAGASGKAVKPAAIETNKFYWGRYSHKLVSTPGSNNLGDPTTTWYYKNSKVGVYADAPVLTYTTKWTWAQAKEDLEAAGYMIDTVTNTANTDYDTAVYFTGNDTETGWATPALMKENVKDTTKNGGYGVVTKFYANSDNYLDLVVTTKYYLGEVTGITKDKASTKLIDESALTLDYGYGVNTYTVVADTDTTGFADVYANAEEGDYFLIAPKTAGMDQDAADNVLAIVAPKTVEGTLSFSGINKIKLNGVDYTAAATSNGAFGTASATETFTAYLDEYGYVYATDAAASDDTLAGVIDAYQTLDGGKLVWMVKMILSDGTITDVKANDNYTGNVGGVYTYTKDTAGKITGFNNVQNGNGANLTAADAGIEYEVTADALTATSKKLTWNTAAHSAYFADDVKFIYVDNTSATVKTTVKEGVQKIAAPTVVNIVLDSDGFVSTVMINAKAANTVTDTGSILFLKETKYWTGYALNSVTNTNDTVYGYYAYINGKSVDGFYSENDAGNVGFYAVEKDSDNGAYLLNEYNDEGEDIQAAGITLNADGRQFVNSKLLDLGGDDVVTVNSSTTIVSTNSDFSFSSLSELKSFVVDGEYTVDAYALYDKDTGVASYLYLVIAEAGV